MNRTKTIQGFTLGLVLLCTFVAVNFSSDSGFHCAEAQVPVVGNDTGVDIRPGELDNFNKGGNICKTNSHVQPPYSQGSYGTSYRQSGYSSSYSQGSYKSGGVCSNAGDPCGLSGSSYSQSSYYNQGAYFTCPAGYTVYNKSGYQGNYTETGSCCPNADFYEEDTNGDDKGGLVGMCRSDGSAGNNNGNTGGSPNSCTINGTTVPNGGTYTFYTQSSVPYNEQCSTYATDLTCVNGSFQGSNGLYSSCTVNDAPEIEAISITATPPIVRYGESSTITWDGANAEACTVTGYGLTNVTGVTGSEVVNNVTGESTYTLNCTLGPNSRSASTTLKVLPRSQET